MAMLLQFQSTILHPNQMCVDVGANFHDFYNNHLVYVLFVQPNYFEVSGGSTFLNYVVGMVSVNLLGSHALHSLAPAYWTPTEHTNIISIRALNM